MSEILRLIQELDSLDRETQDASVETEASISWPPGQEDMEQLLLAMRAAGRHTSPELAQLLEKLGQVVAEGQDMKRVVQQIQKLPLPLPIVLPERPAMRSTGVNTTAIVKETPLVSEALGEQRDFEGELRRLRETLEARIRAAEEEAERQRLRAEEALKRLEEETKRLEALIAELRKKLRELHALLEKAGLGKQAQGFQV